MPFVKLINIQDDSSCSDIFGGKNVRVADKTKPWFLKTISYQNQNEKNFRSSCVKQLKQSSVIGFFSIQPHQTPASLGFHYLIIHVDQVKCLCYTLVSWQIADK